MKQMSIQALRINNNMTQDALAQKLGITSKTVSLIETGKIVPKPVYIYAIAYIFKVDADLIRV